MSQILYNLVQTMEMAIFLRMEQDKFKLLSHPSDWIRILCSPDLNTGHTVDLGKLFPFVECFLHEAEEVWSKGITTPHRSGPWLEYSKERIEIPLEASALCSGEHEILIIKDLGAEYYNQAANVQKLRHKALHQEQLQATIAEKNKAIRHREEEIAIRLLGAADHRDQETAAHVRRIGLYAEVMAIALGWDASLAADIRIAAPMHDIGKIGIPDRVLLKPGKLTTDEFDEMKKHTAIGADMLKGCDIGLFAMASDIALCHHERWNGMGYPQGLKGKEIPEAARITTIVDVYDALCHKRVYKEAWNEADALKTMSEMVGINFDPDLYDVFIANLPKMRAIREG